MSYRNVPVRRVIIVGETFVGKTSLLHRFCHSAHEPTYLVTITCDFEQRLVELGDGYGAAMRMQLWDTAGQERFRSVLTRYYRGAEGVVLVYDVTSRESFRAMGDYWADVLEREVGLGAARLVVGNKIDCEPGERRVPRGDAEAFALSFGAAYAETSARFGKGVEEAFVGLGRAIRDRDRAVASALAIVNRRAWRSPAPVPTDGARRTVALGEGDEAGERDEAGASKCTC